MWGELGNSAQCCQPANQKKSFIFCPFLWKNKDKSQSEREEWVTNRMMKGVMKLTHFCDGCTLLSACPQIEWTLLISTFNYFRYGWHVVNRYVIFCVVFCKVLQNFLDKNTLHRCMLPLGPLLISNVWWHVCAWCHPLTVSFLRQRKYHLNTFTGDL